MTLILTQISKHGIILASDSNLTSDVGDEGEGQKVFRIPYLNAGLCLAGIYGVGGISMDVWMNRFIQRQASIPNLTLAQFAHKLKEALEGEMTSDELDTGNLIQIAGYAEEDGVMHPELWFVRNIYGIDPNTGEYIDFRREFKVDEDFWSRDCQQNNSQISFENGGYQLYVNGFSSGRISYVILQQALSNLLGAIWQNPHWAFRPPVSLNEATHFVKLYMQFINTLFLSSNYPARYIGGTVQLETIPSPENSTLECT